jgi:hypothetical protein
MSQNYSVFAAISLDEFCDLFRGNLYVSVLFFKCSFLTGSYEGISTNGKNNEI